MSGRAEGSGCTVLRMRSPASWSRGLSLLVLPGLALAACASAGVLEVRAPRASPLAKTGADAGVVSAPPPFNPRTVSARAPRRRAVTLDGIAYVITAAPVRVAGGAGVTVTVEATAVDAAEH